MCDGCMDWIDRVAEEIEAHVSDHPDASDTVAGIAEWWIGQRRYLEAEENVEAALARLVDRGAFERLSRPGAPDRYRRAAPTSPDPGGPHG
ncbi:MAG: hypothetical protein VYD87_11760 [Pseudomonadota bacterium]|nr:hypothetical protein [Pseudomonadota bacterium]MEE3101683.1 hypothetical protein [Pseudomonadota bacterium]